MQDAFAGHVAGLTAPATEAEPISPSDGEELGTVTRALYVGQPGTVRLRLLSGATVTLANMQGGMLYPIRARQVFATGTTAADIVGLS